MINDSEMIFVGLDVSKDTLEVACDDKRTTLTFGNDEAGIQALLAHIKAAQSTGGRVGAVVLEATGGFERDAAMALCGAGLPVMVVNPRQARDFAKARPGIWPRPMPLMPGYYASAPSLRSPPDAVRV